MLGGNINFKLKNLSANWRIKNFKLRKGFSLVELTVVMAIMAILGMIGAPALLNARQQYMVDSVTEDIVSTIRTAQNNAISVRDIQGCSATKVWFVKIIDTNNGDYSLRALCANGAAVTTLPSSPVSLKAYSGVKISGNANIYFSTPFGEASLFNADAGGWTEDGNSPEKKYISSAQKSTNPIVITININGKYQRTITISPDGDVDAS